MSSSASDPFSPSPLSTEKCKICVLGGGSYGTALAYVAAAHRGHEVSLLVRTAEQAAIINETHRNPRRFPDTNLPNTIVATSDVKEAVKDASLVLHAIPAQVTPEFLRSISAHLVSGVPLVSTSKGIHVMSHKFMPEAIAEALGSRASEIPQAFLSGPSFAKEMVLDHPISVVVASEDLSIARRVSDLISSVLFRVYLSDDVVGVEVGGALKNPLAIGAGMASGLGYGQSTIASLVTRGSREISMISAALGGKSETQSGLSGVGDLMLTCFSSLSRNNRFGVCLARGLSVEEAIKEIGETVEGFPTAQEIVRIGQEHGLRLPLFNTLGAILNGDITPKDALKAVMSSAPGHELRGHEIELRDSEVNS